MYWYQHDPALRRREFHQGVNIVPADRVYLSHLLYEDLYRAGKVLVDDSRLFFKRVLACLPGAGSFKSCKPRSSSFSIGVVPPE